MSSSPRSRPPAARWVPAPWLEHGSYVAVALLAVSAALLASGHVVGDGVDLYGTFWFYWWIADCVEHLRDPSFTDLMFHPLGKDIFAHTGDNFVDALVSVPFQWLLGFPRYQPWFVAVVLWGNALTFRPLARELLGRGPAAWGSTLLWLICPYTLFELMTGRITQAFLWFLPPAVLWFLRIGRPGRAGVLWAPLLAGLFTGLLAWTYWFYGYFVVLAMAWLALLALLRPELPRRRLLAGYLVAGLACLLVVAPGIVGMAGRAAQGAVPGLVSGDGGGLLDRPRQLGNNVASMLHGYVLLETQGQPMFASILWGGGLVAWAVFGRERLRFGGIALIALAFAVGPVWPTGSGGLVMPHYMLAYRYLPFFDRLWFPYRLVVMAMFAATIGLGTVMARWESVRPSRLPAWLLPVSLVVVGAIEQHRNLALPLLHRDLTPPAVYTALGERGGGLVELPIGLARVSIAWQPVHRQPTFGGMGENAPIFWPAGYKRRLSNPFVHFLRELTRDPERVVGFDPADVERLRADGFRWVVLDRHLVDSDLHRQAYGRRATPEQLDRAPFLVQERITGGLGKPVAVDGPLVVWDLTPGEHQPFPGDLRPTAESLSTRTWPTDDMPEYEQHLRETGRIR